MENRKIHRLMPRNLVIKEVNRRLQVLAEPNMKSTGCYINNASRQDMSDLEGMITRFYPYAKGKLQFQDDIGVNLVSDPENSKDPFGKTAYYDPNKMEITVFVDKRHVKDMLRSFSHELVHHAQNCRGEFDASKEIGPGYAQKDPHMRRMEAEAYLLGNGFLVRDYEDQMKCRQLKENKHMSITKEQATQIAEKLIEEMLPEQFAAHKQSLQELTGVEEGAGENEPGLPGGQELLALQQALDAISVGHGGLNDHNLETIRPLWDALVAAAPTAAGDGFSGAMTAEPIEEEIPSEYRDEAPHGAASAATRKDWKQAQAQGFEYSAQGWRDCKAAGKCGQTIEEMKIVPQGGADKYHPAMTQQEICAEYAKKLQQEKDAEDAMAAGGNMIQGNGSFLRDWEKRYPSHKRCQAQLSEEEGNVNEEINHRNNLLFETLMNKWTK
jgi:hypothetical protein